MTFWITHLLDAVFLRFVFVEIFDGHCDKVGNGNLQWKLSMLFVSSSKNVFYITRDRKMSRWNITFLVFISWKTSFVINSFWESKRIEIKLMSWTCTKFKNEEGKSCFMLCQVYMTPLLSLLVVELVRRSNVPWQHCIVEWKGYGSSGNNATKESIEESKTENIAV